MITPKFSIKQTPNHVILEISTPSGRLEDVEIAYSENLFMFSCKPYYLRLHLPGEVIAYELEKDADEVLSCDFDKNQFKIQMKKKTPGEEFTGLEDLPSLLNPANLPPGVVEVEGGVFGEDGEAEAEFLKQELPEEDENRDSDVISKYGYGFNFKKHGELGRFKEELKDLFDNYFEIEKSPIEERSELCKKLDVFDPQYFLADYFDPPPELEECISFKLPKMSLTPEDEEELSKIRKKPRNDIRDDTELRHVLLGLIDILYAYVYDTKMNLGESTCESSWTYAKLAPTLSCLVRYESALEAFTSAIRRSLCYGLYRNFDFGMACAQEVAKIVEKDGIPGVLHILLHIRKSLAVETHYRYLLNNLFLDDYCRFLRDLLEVKNETSKESHQWTKEDFSWLSLEISYVVKKITMKDIDLDLEKIIEEGGLNVDLNDGNHPTEVLDSDDDEVES